MADMGTDVAAVAAHSVLPEMYHPLYTTLMPVHTYVFGICATGTAEARTFQRTGTGRLENTTVQPLGRVGI